LKDFCITKVLKGQKTYGGQHQLLGLLLTVNYLVTADSGQHQLLGILLTVNNQAPRGRQARYPADIALNIMQ